MGGKITVKENSSKMAPYNVSGDTLKDIWADIKAKGPKANGQDRAGYTTAPVTSPNSFNFDGKVKEDKKKGEFYVEVWIKSATFTCSPTIEHPKLTSDKKLSDKAKKEWKRFMSELLAHEKEHVAETVKAAKKFCDELADLVGKGTDADKEEAKKKARADHDKQKTKSYTDAELQKRLDKANTDLDSGGHGPTLDISIT